MAGILRLAESFEEQGFRLTPGRRAVIQVLENADRHLSPAEVLGLGQQVHPRLSRATVYRALEQLTALGMIRPIYLGGGDQRFATAAGCDHHLVCIQCGSITEFEECGLQEFQKDVASRYGFEITSHLFELRGFCAQCRENKDRTIDLPDSRPV